MPIAKIDQPIPQKPLRLWPGVATAVLLCVMRFVIPIVVPEATVFGMIGSVLAALAILVWWVFFSRAPWSERIGAIILMIVAVYATRLIVHPSIANAGMGMMLPIFSIPVMSLALVAWAAATRRLSSELRCKYEHTHYCQRLRDAAADSVRVAIHVLR